MFVHPLAIDTQHAREVSCVDKATRLTLVHQLENPRSHGLRDHGGYGRGDCTDVLATQMKELGPGELIGGVRRGFSPMAHPRHVHAPVGQFGRAD